ncbi:MAG: SDR family oxidoreductase [Gammaproteobacteria bacterium]|jgi:3(or 17)beta-hydroxysteroid dehydrogenase|nr:SDR family oxidoreductase [Gammaproteobacteria bacterium]MBT3866334.1 SDR family oxidoreductase [Gammaproteobacteria bacterium]MBT4378542.1 SDR family oxidoreductase [Gammaproteobacteria bacterium]MBT4616005.1 SDR family oxidoreductase [Gammaproteobacteria bacterium]MBT5199523.1 SDR family oxidoreductase [Gammaproteobacteria bacterium]
MGRVDEKVCLVTGGGSGLGRADAIALAGEGARVVITDISKENGEEAAHAAGNGAIYLPHDVAEDDQWQQVVKQTVDHFGELNVLVNNAGMFIPGSVEDVTWDQYRLHQRIHMDGTFFGIKYGIETIKLNGKPGSIINIASTTALLGYHTSFAYGACKGAIRTMTTHAAVHCQQNRYNIRANCVFPSVIQTPLIEKLYADAAAAAEAKGIEPPAPIPPEEQLPSPGLGEPMDVGYAVLFLASDEAKFINGAELRVDNCSVVNPAPL